MIYETKQRKQCKIMEKYMLEYSEKMASAETMIYDRFRKKESLNGTWHYAVDQYDTCIRAKWFEENYPCKVLSGYSFL